MLRETLFQDGKAGTRCLLDITIVAETARIVRDRLAALDALPTTAIAIQAIAFDKTPTANWKVTWHQDLMFPFAARVTQPGYDLPAKKDGIDYARPPRPILERLLAVRVHLDDCDEANGPLRVAPGSHRHGILPSAEISTQVSHHGEIACLGQETEALLMRPLLLHASSPARAPRHRRVLHLVFDTGENCAERWHRTV